MARKYTATPWLYLWNMIFFSFFFLLPLRFVCSVRTQNVHTDRCYALLAGRWVCCVCCLLCVCVFMKQTKIAKIRISSKSRFSMVFFRLHVYPITHIPANPGTWYLHQPYIPCIHQSRYHFVTISSIHRSAHSKRIYAALCQPSQLVIWYIEQRAHCNFRIYISQTFL